MFRIIKKSKGYRLGLGAFDELRFLGLPDLLLESLRCLKDKHYQSKKEFTDIVQGTAEKFLVDTHMYQILKSARVLQSREIIRYITSLSYYRYIRYNVISNAIINYLYYRKLAYGRHVIIDCMSQNNLRYDKDVRIGDFTRIYIRNRNCQLQLAQGVSINEHCRIEPDRSGIKIGKRSRIQDFGHISGQVTIGEDVIIAPNFYISSGLHVFKEAPYFLLNIQDHLYDGLSGHCFIEDDCWIGMNVCVMPGVRIRRGCIIGAGAIVTRSTEPYGIYGGVPAKKIGTRFQLEAMEILDANISENLPYFYQGFDHYNYLNYKDKFQGILTDSVNFFIYTEFPQVKSILLEIESTSKTSCLLTYQNFNFQINKGNNYIKINNIKVVNKLIGLECNESLIIKKSDIFK